MTPFKTLLFALAATAVLTGPTGSAPAAAADAQPAKPAPRGVPVEAAKVRIGTVEHTIDAVGSLLSNESVIVRPEIAGRIVGIGFAEGSAVKQGSMLVELDASTLRAELQQTRAAQELSRKNFERARELFGKGAGTARALDEAEAKLKVDEASVVLAEVMLRKTVIRAPFGGIVGLRKISPGDYVSPGQDLVSLDEVDPIKVAFRVPEVALTAVKVGQELAVGLDAFGDNVFVGVVQAIDPTVDSRTRSFTVHARVPNPGGALRPGLFARVVLRVERRDDAILVPEEAIVPIGARTVVYRVVDGRAAMTDVTLGLRRDALVEIRKGVGPEDVVVTAGQQKLGDGAPVMVLPAQPRG